MELIMSKDEQVVIRKKINKLREFWGVDCGRIAKEVGYSKSYVYGFLYDALPRDRNPVKLVEALDKWYYDIIRKFNEEFSEDTNNN